jgi:hypothetical protein
MEFERHLSIAAGGRSEVGDDWESPRHGRTPSEKCRISSRSGQPMKRNCVQLRTFEKSKLLISAILKLYYAIFGKSCKFSARCGEPARIHFPEDYWTNGFQIGVSQNIHGESHPLPTFFGHKVITRIVPKTRRSNGDRVRNSANLECQFELS